MSKRNQLVVSLLVLCSSVLMLFQNCGKGFSLAEETTADGLSLASHNEPHIVSNSLSIEPNRDLEFVVFDESLTSAASFQWSHTFDGVANGCTQKNGTVSNKYILNCAQNGKLAVAVIVLDGTEQKPVSNLVATVATPPPAGVEISLTVNFNIPAGTGRNPWNTAATTVETFVGQTLVLRNSDSMNHQLHTGGRPCPHGSTIASGGATTCIVGSAYDPVTNGRVYDHGIGSSAQFFVVAYDGAALYAQNCMSCHGALASSTKAKARVSQIRNAINSVGQMKTTALLQLSPRQIEAISFALGNR